MTRFPPITTKKEMYALLTTGRLGHTLPTAETLPDVERLMRNGGLFAVRMKEAGGLCEFHLTPDEVRARLACLREGVWNVSAMLEDKYRVCYCHLLDGPGGWNLHYSETQKPCRLKIKDGCEQKNLFGLAARFYLRGVMDQKGWDTLVDLVEAYPNHVIEFTVMATRFAAHGDTNTVFWEVRVDGGQYERGSEWDR